MVNVGQQSVEKHDGLSPISCAALSILVSNLRMVVRDLYDAVGDENMREQVKSLEKRIVDLLAKHIENSCTGSLIEIRKNIDIISNTLRGMFAGWRIREEEYLRYLESMREILESMREILERESAETYMTAEYPSVVLAFGSRHSKDKNNVDVKLTALENTVLESLKKSQEGATLSKLAQRLGRDKATIYRCLRVLMSLGLVKKETDEKGRVVYKVTNRTKE